LSQASPVAAVVGSSAPRTDFVLETLDPLGEREPIVKTFIERLRERHMRGAFGDRRTFMRQLAFRLRMDHSDVRYALRVLEKGEEAVVNRDPDRRWFITGFYLLSPVQTITEQAYPILQEHRRG
jgi:hypothetical protein